MKRTLLIVSVYRPDLLMEVRQRFAVARDVEVIVDRRVGERRAPARAESEASRRADRRRAAVDRALREHGFAVVRVRAEED
jgi:hypothetical protein